MKHNQQPNEDGSNGGTSSKRSFLNTPAGFALCVLLAIGAGWLWIDHRVHILAALPLLLPLLLCVGMHFFMHRGHGGGGHGGGGHGGGGHNR
ncbi:DUF2933 domain-containing protein [Fodinicurvata sediminis]|uniref:DUF2933 domain-containing protein n=1 Tax=Fodinicurvata sediminis TaxID=1121832 RepID=UPI0009DBFEC1|nr:DUF2933 domain-containing protein [Fodinicurvata sediminis]